MEVRKFFVAFVILPEKLPQRPQAVPRGVIGFCSVCSFRARGDDNFCSKCGSRLR
ncbi:MAG: hypothetical protein Q8O89_08760 [Nanoarchaeota archaeon]|nr:hypothetical protein [Nanoarchaeota archaeon]